MLDQLHSFLFDMQNLLPQLLAILLVLFLKLENELVVFLFSFELFNFLLYLLQSVLQLVAAQSTSRVGSLRRNQKPTDVLLVVFHYFFAFMSCSRSFLSDSLRLLSSFMALESRIRLLSLLVWLKLHSIC